MVATIVHVWVKPEYVNEFIEASFKNHRESIKETGNLRFDFLQDATDPNKFTFYEAYESEDNITAHKKTQHYLTWRETVADMMAKPREGVRHDILYPKKK